MPRIKHAKRLKDLPAPRHAAVMEEIRNAVHTDRAAAIIGAAYVDMVLREAISERMAQRDHGVIELLFEDRGPLQPFGAKIQLGYALGIYALGIYQDLRAIKDIRNAFAHSAEALD